LRRPPTRRWPPRLYLAANPDVLGVDPLAHFLQFGYQENRSRSPPHR
jgi:hypothetical protein